MRLLKDPRRAAVPVVRNSYAQAFASQLESRNLPVTAMARRAHLPLMIDNPRAFTPKRPVFRFLDEVSMPELRLLGLDIGLSDAASSSEPSLVASACTEGSILIGGLRTLLRFMRREANELPIGLEHLPGGIWLWYWGLTASDSPERPPPSTSHAELLILGIFLTVIRAYLGEHWQPRMVHVQATLELDALRERFPGTAFVTRHDLLRVWIPTHHLGATCATPPAQRRTGTQFDTPPSGLVPGLTEALTVCFSDASSSPITLGFAAEITRLSERTLQRKLQEQGLTFRDLVDQALYASSSRYLKGGSISVSEIAAMHGYDDASHFVRAFRRVAGVTPGAYRNA